MHFILGFVLKLLHSFLNRLSLFWDIHQKYLIVVELLPFSSSICSTHFWLVCMNIVQYQPDTLLIIWSLCFTSDYFPFL